MTEETKNEFPQRGAKDAIHTGIKTALSAIPVLGGSAAEIFAAVFVPPLEKRRDAFLQSLFERLQELESKIDGFKMESLKDNDRFISIVIHATQAAIRNHQEEKHKSLRNAVLNIAVGKIKEEIFDVLFIGLIESFTEWHILLLSKVGATYVPGMPAWKNAELCLPQLEEFPGLAEQLLTDLESHGLITINETLLQRGHQPPPVEVTMTGQQFLKFVQSPL